MTTDFSVESKKALPYAAIFAKRLRSEVALLHVIEPPPRFNGWESLALLVSGDAAIGRAYQGLHSLAEETFTSKEVVRSHVRTGKPFHEIVKAARGLEADLLIMGTHGYTGLKHAFLGSTTERVIRQAPCPVLTVRALRDVLVQKPIRHMVLATDFSKNSLKAFPLAQSLAASFRAKVTLIHVVERFPIDAILGEVVTRETTARLMDEARKRLSELSNSLRKESGFKTDIAVRLGTPFGEITRVAKESDASLIIMGTHGYTGLKHIYLGSVAERVVRYAHCPVLVVPDTAK